MVETILVDGDIQAGRQLLAALDGSGVAVDVAYWLYQLELGRWRLVFASPLVDTVGRTDLYRRIRELLEAGAAPGLTLEDVSVVPVRDRIASGLHRILGAERLEEFRPTGAVVNGMSVDDAYVYRTRPKRVAAGDLIPR